MVFTKVKNEISLKCCERKMDIEQKSLLKSFLPKNWSLSLSSLNDLLTRSIKPNLLC